MVIRDKVRSNRSLSKRGGLGEEGGGGEAKRETRSETLALYSSSIMSLFLLVT